ncbi:CLUMA_CG012541, isoform A [Clunio marinus]|uniref:CLUMA_CG012541, isoform A n=1 Tax=Clunio marinus TaxID=568069 RepID=A0A1J1IL54_9DIPT|nr:CLUMA_CG012541, isoform A [Clunio marinus]
MEGMFGKACQRNLFRRFIFLYVLKFEKDIFKCESSLDCKICKIQLCRKSFISISDEKSQSLRNLSSLRRNS